jgi:uncharacterized protein YpuA (DUF1002 family)
MSKEFKQVLCTALLTTLLSTGSSYFILSNQAKSEKVQFQFELKTSAYSTFLNSISKTQSPIIAEILNAGKLINHSNTDMEIQYVEDSFERFVKLNGESKIYEQLDSHFNLLRLHGSEKVRNKCEDILTVLAYEEFKIDWTKYPQELQKFRAEWLNVQKNGKQSGIELKVRDDERIMFILLTALFQNLIDQLRTEMQD